MNMKIFLLENSDESWGNISYESFQKGAIHIPFEGEQDISFIHTDKKIVLPEKICFASDFNIVPNIDFLHNDLLLNIFSKKMFNILKKIEPIELNMVPVRMHNHKELEVYHIKEGEGLNDLKEYNDDYITFQLTKYTDAFDYLNSKYEMDDLFEDEIGYVHKLIFKKPIGGFPAIFKIKEKFGKLFITEQAKNALEEAGIKGCVFEEVEVSS